MKHNTAKTANVSSINNQVKLGISLCVASALWLSSPTVQAAERISEQGLGTYSQARVINSQVTESDTDKQARMNALHEQVKLPSNASSAIQKVTREQVMAKNKKAAATVANKQQRALALQNQVVYYDFSFYGADSRLLEDYDYDGFYQTFSVTFDADINSSAGDIQADVFAELYLSQDGGPWVHYYSTDVFTLHADSSNDDYEVLTTLANGYQTDHYDVLIDLYELGYADPVATISSDESNALYALPLESSDRDAVYVEEVYIENEHSGGSLSWLSISFLAGFIGLRRRMINKI
ncbi:choice-of-anchor H family protein [Shewanella livingstonensis]|uniref:GlyGly-CTERM sorting domain-containing protein n=1 Tax=Shewanella livingstonensis TaxID=150120 RepID=A0A3G8LSS7_9GAMM|nr:choice-of-anchor H family protein [Shewanella livingstonensis]AZG72611.1 GlyGly-CTERM sorting domain-containing protein [Shewanella livingstonensis]